MNTQQRVGVSMVNSNPNSGGGSSLQQTKSNQVKDKAGAVEDETPEDGGGEEVKDSGNIGV